MKFLDLFAGIGGFRLGMERAGHECVGYVEWDKYARKSYEAIHNTEGEWTAHDIRTVTDNDFRLLRERGIDIICGGFPCQAFSVAGKRGGFEDTRGTMFFEIARFAQQIQPRYLFLENVKGLLSHDKGNTFGTILHTLDELGYDAEWQVLNSKNFGVPQNRERVFLIGHLRGGRTRKIFPIQAADGETTIPVEIIAHRKGYRRNTQVFAPTGITEALDTGQGGGRGHYTIEPDIKVVGTLSGGPWDKRHECNRRVYDPEGLSPSVTAGGGGGVEPKVLVNVSHGQIKVRDDDTATALDANMFKGLDNHGQRTGVLVPDYRKVAVPVLTPDRMEKRQNGRRFKEDGEPMFTLTAQDRHGVAVLRPVRTDYGKEIRKAYENGEVWESRHNMRKWEPRQDGISNTLTSVQKDNLVVEPLPAIIQKNQQGKVYVKDHAGTVTQSMGSKQAPKVVIDDTQAFNGVRVYEDIAPTLRSERFGLKTLEKPDFIPGPDEVNRTLRSGGKNTLTAKHNYDHIHDGYRIRKLTPRECWRLQSFPDWAFERASEVNSDSQLYKQAGNSVTVEVIYEIARHFS